MRLIDEVEKIGAALAHGELTALERDIVLGRLRVVYDAVLSLPVVAAEQIEHAADTVHTAKSTAEEERSFEPEPVHERESETISEPYIPEEEADGECVSNSETSMPEPESVQEPESEPEPDFELDPMPSDTKEPEPEFTIFTRPAVRREVIESLYGDQGQGTIIFNETISVPAGNDLASVLSSKAVSQIADSLGINDRFLLIRELFDNDAELFEKTIARLDQFTDIDDAYIYVQENFSAATDNEGFKLLISAIEKKLK